MSRPLSALIVFLLLASCGGRYGTPPSNMDNACATLQQRPGYGRAFAQTQAEWGVPAAVQMATIYQESKFISNARTPRKYRLGFIPAGRQSSAYGYSQALDGTWDDYVKAQGRFGARRNDIRDATDFMGWYMNRSRERNGIALSDARNQYLAYHEGHGGYARGSHNAKSWLLRVASNVESRAYMYDAQLRSCPHLLR